MVGPIQAGEPTAAVPQQNLLHDVRNAHASNWAKGITQWIPTTCHHTRQYGQEHLTLSHTCSRHCTRTASRRCRQPRSSDSSCSKEFCSRRTRTDSRRCTRTDSRRCTRTASRRCTRTASRCCTRTRTRPRM